MAPDDDEVTKVGVTADIIPGARSRDKAYLVALSGETIGQLYPLPAGETVVGRGTQATVKLNDDGISRKHARLLRRGGEVLVEDMQSANGTYVNDEEVRGQRLLRDGDKIRLGATTVLKFTYHDEVEENYRQRMYDAALRDGLTNAFNKKFFLDRLNTELSYARRHNSPLSLVMFDVDFFKRLNDSFGHLAGDDVLVKLAAIGHQSVRTEDVFARYGGEEFAVLCRACPLHHAGAFAERLRALVATTSFEWNGTRLPVTISCGVAGYPECGAQAPEQLIMAADAALYEAKRAGRDRVIVRS
ncbi:MAG: GGDEF domain-containing protein [Myxococcales bacterium]|nr:GGDEF domain-containing protein [Myxococcales bacterium]